MRRELADALRRMADWIHTDDRHELVEIVDEWGICRCRLSITTDSHHGIDQEFDALPSGWIFRTEED